MTNRIVEALEKGGWLKDESCCSDYIYSSRKSPDEVKKAIKEAEEALRNAGFEVDD